MQQLSKRPIGSVVTVKVWAGVVGTGSGGNGDDGRGRLSNSKHDIEHVLRNDDERYRRDDTGQ